MKNRSGMFILTVALIAALVGCVPAATPAPTTAPAAPTTDAAAPAAPADVSSLPEELKNGLSIPDAIPAPDVITTMGPDGQVATWYTELHLTPEEVAQVRSMNLRAGFELINASEWDNANLTGFKAASELLNIELAAQANCDLDPIKQKANMEQFASLDLDIVTCQPQDLDVAAATFDPLYEQGVKMVYMSNVPTGYEPGKQYVGAITDSLIDMGVDAAEMMAEAVGGAGDVISIEVAGVNYVTNTRDKAFRDTIAEKFPDINVVEIGGFQKPTEAGLITSGLLTKYPDVKGIYVSYSTPAIDVIQVLKSLGRDDVKIVTMDLDTTASLDMAEGGNVYGIAVDLPYAMGFGRAIMAAYGVIGKPCPAYVASPSFKATKENLAEAYLMSFGVPAPQEVLDALNK